jgi:hypothetical protein
LWRLAQEPRRLAHRYLVAGPPGALALWRDSRLLTTQVVIAEAGQRSPAAAVIPVQRDRLVQWDGQDRRAGLRRACDRAVESAPTAVVPEQRPAERRGDDRRLAAVAQR